MIYGVFTNTRATKLIDNKRDCSILQAGKGINQLVIAIPLNTIDMHTQNNIAFGICGLQLLRAPGEECVIVCAAAGRINNQGEFKAHLANFTNQGFISIQIILVTKAAGIEDIRRPPTAGSVEHNVRLKPVLHQDLNPLGQPKIVNSAQ